MVERTGKDGMEKQRRQERRLGAKRGER